MLLNGRNRASGIARVPFSGDKENKDEESYTQTHTWNINTSYIDMIKNAHMLQKFESAVFEMHNAKWKIILYPNGNTHKHKGHINLHLEILEFPSNISKIECQFKLCIIELNAEFESTKEISKHDTIIQWSPFLIKTYKLKNITQSLSCFVETAIIKMYNFHNQQLKNENINNNLLTTKSIHIPFSSENNIPLETNLINIDEPAELEGNNILSDTDEKQMLTKLINSNSDIMKLNMNKNSDDLRVIRHSKSKSMTPIIYNVNKNKNKQHNEFPNAPRKLTTVSTLGVKVEIVNDLLQIHDMKFTKMGKQMKEMQEMIAKLNDKLDGFNEKFDVLNDKLEKELMSKKIEMKDEDLVVSPMLLAQISPAFSSFKNPEITILQEMNDDNEKKESSMSMNHTGVRNWLCNKCLLPQYFETFIEHGIEDLSVVKLLTIEELNDLGIDKMGHKLKILHEIDELKQCNQVNDNNV
eukprot:162323_1